MLLIYTMRTDRIRMETVRFQYENKEAVRNTLVFLLLCVVQVSAFAGGSPIVADRPGFSTGTYTVKPGKLNVELGYQYAFNTNPIDQSTQTLPLLVLRTGLSSKVELDLLWDGWNIDHADNQSSDTSVADVSIGGKYRIHESSKYNLTLLGLLSLPTGSSPSTSDNVDPLFGLLWDYSLSSQPSLFGVVQASSFKYEGSRVYDAQVAIGVSFSHTDRIGSFIEIYSILPSEVKLDDEIVMDGGITYLLSNDVQLDINVGAGLNDTSTNFVGFGIASRF